MRSIGNGAAEVNLTTERPLTYTAAAATPAADRLAGTAAIHGGHGGRNERRTPEERGSRKEEVGASAPLFPPYLPAPLSARAPARPDREAKA
jgi:hypothetical protein